MRPAYLSVSQLNAFLACPARYRFRYVDQVEPAFRSGALALGSAVHSALDWLHRAWKGSERPSAEKILRMFEADLTAQFYDGVAVRGDAGALKSIGRSLLELYFQETPVKEVRAVELPFEVPVVDPRTGEELPVPFRGYIDLIEADGTLVELKTAARKPDKTALRLHLQLTAYSYAMTRIYRERPKARLDCLLKTKEPRLERIPVEREEADDGRLFTLASTVLGAIEAGSFFPNPGWMCRDCEFRRVCPVWVP
jgi:putative RecB family exonuclease